MSTTSDDRAEQDARHLVPPLFVAVSPLRRAEVMRSGEGVRPTGLGPGPA